LRFRVFLHSLDLRDVSEVLLVSPRRRRYVVLSCTCVSLVQQIVSVRVQF
jgi:hypothetical protein